MRKQGIFVGKRGGTNRIFLLKTKSAIFAFGLILALLSNTTHLHAQNPFPLKLPTLPKSSNQNPLGGWEATLKQKAAEKAVGTLLNNQLPLKLDADAIYPTVASPPGGLFAPRPLALTANDLDKPLPPGDYTVSMLAFCTEYSVHRPGRGLAYRLGPLQGKAAGAIGMLLWRGVLIKNRPPQQLQAVSWAIQSGLMYSQMPKTYQAVIDDVIPDYKNQLSGDFVQGMEDTYSSYAKGTQLPPLEQMLAKMGKPGELALSARRQRQALLRQNTSDQVKEQTLFAGQEAGVYTPLKAEEGPWTEKIAGVAYLRYKIGGGNMARDNIMEIRILPRQGTVASRSLVARLVYASYIPSSDFEPEAPLPQDAPQNSATPENLLQGSIGCAVGQGAQCLAPVPVITNNPAPGTGLNQALNNPNNENSIGKVVEFLGNVTITHDGVTKPLEAGDSISMGDTITTAANSAVFVQFADNTQMTLSPDTKLTVDNYVYDPASNRGSASYGWLEGGFQYIGGLLDKKEKPDVGVDIAFGCICIRGTEFIATRNPATGKTEVDLIQGAVDLIPKRNKPSKLFNAPIRILFDESATVTSPLTQSQYDAIKAKTFPSALASKKR